MMSKKVAGGRAMFLWLYKSTFCCLRTVMPPMTDTAQAKPKFHYTNFPETSLWHVSRVSRQHESRYREVTGKFRGFKPSHMSRWFEKSPWQVGNQSVCVEETRKLAKSATRHGEVGDVADKSMGISRVYHGHCGEVGIVESGLYRTSRESLILKQKHMNLLQIIQIQKQCCFVARTNSTLLIC